MRNATFYQLLEHVMESLDDNDLREQLVASHALTALQLQFFEPQDADVVVRALVEAAKTVRRDADNESLLRILDELDLEAKSFLERWSATGDGYLHAPGDG